MHDIEIYVFEIVLTGISCSHILAIIRVKKFELNQFICPFYSAQTFLNNWSGRFYPYPNQIDWPESNGSRIISERRLIRRGRTKHIILVVWIQVGLGSCQFDFLKKSDQGRRVKRGSRLASNNNNSGNILVCK
jgi:hypothetical protein